MAHAAIRETRARKVTLGQRDQLACLASQALQVLVARLVRLVHKEGLVNLGSRGLSGCEDPKVSRALLVGLDRGVTLGVKGSKVQRVCRDRRDHVVQLAMRGRRVSQGLVE